MICSYHLSHAYSLHSSLSLLLFSSTFVFTPTHLYNPSSISSINQPINQSTNHPSLTPPTTQVYRALTRGCLSAEQVQQVVDRTIIETDSTKDGKVSFSDFVKVNGNRETLAIKRERECVSECVSVNKDESEECLYEAMRAMLIMHRRLPHKLPMSVLTSPSQSEPA